MLSPHPRLFLGLVAALLTACGDPGAYPIYEADTGPDLDVIGGSGGGDDGGGITDPNLPTLDAVCATGAAACTATNGESSFIDVINESDRTIDLYWVDSTCTLAFYATAAPGITLNQQAYAGHVWAIVDQQSGDEVGRIETQYPDRCQVRVQ